MANTSMVDANAVDIIKNLAREAAGMEVFHIQTEGHGEGLPGRVSVAFDRKNQKVLSLQSFMEEARLSPARRKGTATAGTLASFIALVNRHKDVESALFGKTSYPDPKLTAVLNYDSAASDARHGDHRVEYRFPLTEEFKAWVGGNAKPMGQADFAAFLEEHAAELAAATPEETEKYEKLFRERFATPSELLELSRHLEVFVSAKARQGIRLQTGERVVEFAEEHQNAKGEKVTIPGIFMISLPAFINGEPVRIPARLRYRISAGDIMWFYQLYRWDFFLREQVELDLTYAAEKTGLPAFDGAPER